MIKYYPHKSDKPNKKYYIITDDNKKDYLVRLLPLILQFIKMKQGNKDILIDTKIMKIGQNQGLIHQVGGPINSCGVIQLKKRHTTT